MFDWFWEFLYGLVKAALYCIDFIVEIAEMLCGIKPVVVDGRSTEITEYFLFSDGVMNAFKAVAVIAFALLFVFTIFSIIKSQAKFGEGRSPLGICCESAKILLYFLLVPFIMYLAAGCISTIMSLIYKATSVGSEGSIGSALFCIFAEEAFISNNGGAMNENLSKEVVMQGFMDGTYDYYSTGTVSTYFDLSDFNYFLGFVGGIATLILLALAMLSFVERILSLMLLFVVAPISMSTAVLDDGARFKLWRDQVINKFIMAYGSLICINMFIVMVDTVRDVNFFDPEMTLFNGLARLVFVVGGAFACRKANALIGNLINHGAGSQDAQDQANLNHGIKGAALMLGGAAARIVAPAMKVATKPVRDAAGHVKKNVSAWYHRDSNAKRTAKDRAAQMKYEERLRRNASPAQSGGQSSVREVMRGASGSTAAGDSGASSGAGSGQTAMRNPSTLNQTSGEITRNALRSIADRKQSEGKKGDD